LRRVLSIPIERLPYEKEYATVLDYPWVSSIALGNRLRELKKLGVRTLDFTGEKRISMIHVLGKGCVGIVVAAHANGKKIALKIRRSDADGRRLMHEARMLKKANSVRVGPRLLGASKDFLLMQLIEGSLLPRWVEAHPSPSQVKKVLRDILVQCWLLDEAGLDHGELSNAPKHVIVDRRMRAVIVDFEAASVKRRPANVTSMCQFLFMSGLACKVAEKIGEADKEGLIVSLRLYKHDRNRSSFERVLKTCGL
jgi:putative serine/threonine protein kinase